MRGPADGRYAPSPSGTLHLGNLRTALLAWLMARSRGGRFAMRIDDLDTERSRPEHAEGQLADLRAIGLEWDGPVVRQSERTAAYESAIDALRRQERLYPCWCTRAELRAAASAPHGELPDGAYPGTCARLDARGRAERSRAAERPPAWRVRAEGALGRAEDALHGRLEAPVDDFVVRRGDGQVAYNLAVVLDDDHQGVAEVVRGDDLRSSAPRQAWLTSVLGLAVPTYAHVPLVLGPDGRRLAKRDGAVTLAERLELGEDADGVRSLLLEGLGLVAPGERPSPTELVAGFDPAPLVGRGPTTWTGG